MRALLRVHAARPLHFEDAPRLHRYVAQTCIAAGVSRPRAYLIEGEVPNAFAIGWTPRRARLVLTRAALERVDTAHVHALLAHEIAHIALGHLFRTTVIALISTAVVLGTARVQRWGLLRGCEDRVDRLKHRILAAMHRLALPPGCEAEADRLAVKLLGGSSALRDAVRASQQHELSFTDPTACHSGCAHLEERLEALRRISHRARTQKTKGIRIPRTSASGGQRRGARG